MASWFKRPWAELASVVAIADIGNLLLYAYFLIFLHGSGNIFLVLNMVLASIPMLLSWRLVASLRYKRWSGWEPLALTFFWLVFLPGSFFGVVDFPLLAVRPSSSLLFAAVLYSSFILESIILGMASIYLVHVELRKRLKASTSAILVAIILIGVSYAIYLGQDMNWNSWDIVLNPGGLIFDISNLISNPHTYLAMARTMASTFVFIGAAYLIVWRSARLIWHRGVEDLAAHIKRTRNS